jgi:transposase InsO family protein
MHEIIRLHGLPTDIVSDRDKLFTSRFFVELQRLLGTRQAMSTAYHPKQTEGQTERANRVLQEVVRHVTTLVQDDWDVKLPCEELA